MELHLSFTMQVPVKSREIMALLSIACMIIPLQVYPEKESQHTVENILLYQRDNGGWPKNFDRDRKLSQSEVKNIQAKRGWNDATFDNGATHTEVRYLAKAFLKTGEPRYREALLKGVELMLVTQYKNGGWPQGPKANGYARHITFNDGAMIGVMATLRDLAANRDAYPFIDERLRTRCRKAVDKGILCILKCQIIVDGRKTAWCAQHDEKTLAPRKARSYELASISGAESVGIVRFLMQVEKPSLEIIAAVQGAVRWFNEAKLVGIREIRMESKGTPKGFDKVIIKDSKAPPIWARFYRIATNEPIFCSRDGIPRKTLAEISYERRNGYSWIGYWGGNLLVKDYPAWQRKWAPRHNVLR
jgi:PelA/Pel-15E family pectate lyase